MRYELSRDEAKLVLDRLARQAEQGDKDAQDVLLTMWHAWLSGNRKGFSSVGIDPQKGCWDSLAQGVLSSETEEEFLTQLAEEYCFAMRFQHTYAGLIKDFLDGVMKKHEWADMYGNLLMEMLYDEDGARLRRLIAEYRNDKEYSYETVDLMVVTLFGNLHALAEGADRDIDYGMDWYC